MLITGSVVVLAAVGWLFGTGSPGEEGGSFPGDPLRPASISGEASHLEAAKGVRAPIPHDLDPSGGGEAHREEVAASGGEGPANPSASAAAQPERTIRTKPLEMEWLERYVHMSRAEFERAVESRGREWSRENKRLADERYRAGIYVAYPFEYDESGELIPLQKTSSAIRLGSPESEIPGWKQFYRDDQAKQWHVVVLPKDLYPEVYEGLEETIWMRKRLGGMRDD